MKVTLVLALACLSLPAICVAEDPPPPPGAITVPEPPPTPKCDSYTMDSLPQLGFKQKACYWRGQLVTGSAIFGAAFFGGIAMAQHTPKEWPQGAQGFGYQFGTRYAQGMLKSTTAFGLGYLLHEDPRPRPPYNLACPSHQHVPHTEAWARLGSSLLRVVWTHHDNSCKDTIAFSRFAGSLASGFIQLAYLPPSQNNVTNALQGTASALGGYAANSVWTEFQGDIFGWLGRRIATGKPKPAPPSHIP